jgi:hypothetical protein
VWRESRTSPLKLREIEHIFDTPPLPPSLVRFVDWVANHPCPARHGAADGAAPTEALQPERPLAGVRPPGRRRNG